MESRSAGSWGARRHGSAAAGQAVTAFCCGQALATAPVPLSLPPGSQLARNPTVWPASNSHRARARPDPCPAVAGRGLPPARRPASRGGAQWTVSRRGQPGACGALSGGRTRGFSGRPCPELRAPWEGMCLQLLNIHLSLGCKMGQSQAQPPAARQQ